MKTSLESTNQPQNDATTKQTAIWNSLKLLASAALCGLAVSFTAAGIAIVLAGDAEARLFQRETALTPPDEKDDHASDDTSLAGPGMLLTGECDGSALPALERDWHIRIEDKRIVVRVMQSFHLPVLSADIAMFHVQLPRGARLNALSAQTAERDWPVQLMEVAQYERLSPEDYLNLTRDKLLVSIDAHGSVMTSPLMNLRPEEVVTVYYNYEIAVSTIFDLPAFSLALEETAPATATHYPQLIDKEISSIRPAAKGSLWVQWTGRLPSRVWGLPLDAEIELSKTRVGGFSTHMQEIGPGASLNLTWSP